MITTLIRRVLPFVGFAILLIGFMRPQQVPPATADLWFHLRFGHEFLHGWSIRSPGHLGPFDTADWIPTQWLSQLAMAWSYERWGIDSVIWAAGVVVLASIGLLFATCCRVAPPLPAALAVTVGAVAASPGFSARPQVLSYLFVVITVAAWLATARDGRARYWLVALAWMWPMCHGMWPVGISISVAAVVGLALDRHATARETLRLAVIPVASMIVALLTPLGAGTYRSLLVIGDRTEYFAEWGPPDFTRPDTAALAVVIALVVVSGLSSRPVPWIHVTFTVLAIGWSLYSLRTTVVGALILTPLLAMALARLVPSGDSLSRREARLVTAMTVVACVALLPVVILRDAPLAAPTWLDDRLDQLPAGSRLLNDWDSGSYFLFRHPDLALVMHGYGDVFTDGEIERNADLTHLRPGWDEQLAGLDVDAALLDPDSPLGYQLEHLQGWTVDQDDDDFVLMTPPSSG